MYRFPSEPANRTQGYYEHEYTAFERGLVTSLPTKEALQALVRAGFRGSQWDSYERLKIILSQTSGGRLLDYGCSWGYFLAQARSEGFACTGYEISRARAEYGRRQLGVDILTELDQLAQLPVDSFDVIYASHVLEHLESPRAAFETFARLLRPGGVVLVFVPNCGGESARRLGLGWGPFSNEAHTLSLDADFFQKNLPQFGFEVTCRSEPYTRMPRLDGDELMVLGRRLELTHSTFGIAQ